MVSRFALKWVVVALAFAGLIIAGVLTASDSATASEVTPGGDLANTGVPAYVGKLPCCPTIVLGPQSNPTIVVQTPPLPAGNYVVTAFAGAVIASNDQVVCAV